MGMTQNLRHLLFKHTDLSSHPYVHIRSQSRLHVPFSPEPWEVETTGLMELAVCQPSSKFSKRLSNKAESEKEGHAASPYCCLSTQHIHTPPIHLPWTDTTKKRKKYVKAYTGKMGSHYPT